MAEFDNGNHFGAGGPSWNPNCAGNGNWNSNFSHSRPSFRGPPPPVPRSPQWMSGPPPSFCSPPPSFSGPPPPGPQRFSGPPPPFSGGFSGPPPPFEGRQPPNAGPHWDSPYNSPASANPWCGSGASQSGGKRPVNNVWSDPSLLTQNQRTSDGPQHRGRGWRGGRGGGRGRGRGRGGHQLQQEHHNNRRDSYENDTHNRNNNNNHNQNNNNSNQNNQGKKKEKVDKRDLPENNKYNCEVCDRGFKTEEKYEEHVSQHTQCWVPGCRYIAAPKLVELHYYAQHKTGLAKKIWSLDNPDAVKKWIEDRKRNYPTKENIARKERERAERIARGELVENKRFGKMRGRGRGWRGGHWGRGRGGYHCEELIGSYTQGHPRTQEPSPGNVSGKGDGLLQNAEQEPTAKKRKLDEEGKDADSKDPLSFGVKGDSSDDSDEDSSSDDSDSSSDSPATQPQGDGLSLIASYKDDTATAGEASSSAVEPTPASDGTGKEEGGEWGEPSNEVVDSYGRPYREEPAWVKHNKRRRDQKHRNNMLLERLLVNEIRHERNVLLQCVHHIVKNNFLGVLDPKTESVGK